MRFKTIGIIILAFTINYYLNSLFYWMFNIGSVQITGLSFIDGFIQAILMYIISLTASYFIFGLFSQKRKKKIEQKKENKLVKKYELSETKE